MTYIDKEILYKNKEIKTRVYLSGCVFAIEKNYARDG